MVFFEKVCFEEVISEEVFFEEVFFDDTSIHKGLNTMSGLGWLQLVCSLKLYVTFAKESYKRDWILQKTQNRHVCSHRAQHDVRYGVATISRLLKIIRLFGEYRSLL